MWRLTYLCWRNPKFENSKGQSPTELAGVSANEAEVKGYQDYQLPEKRRSNEVLRRRLCSRRLRQRLSTITSDVSIWAFELRFTYFDENHNPFKIETRWMYSPNEDGSVSIIPPHSPIDDWHQLTVPTDQASKFKAVSVAVDIAYPPI